MSTKMYREGFESLIVGIEKHEAELVQRETALKADYDKRLADATKDLRNNAAIRATQLADANKQVVELTAKAGTLQVLLTDEQARTRSANEQLKKRSQRVAELELRSRRWSPNLNCGRLRSNTWRGTMASRTSDRSDGTFGI